LFAAVGSIGYYGAYVFIIWQTVSGSITLGSLTFMAGSFRQLRALLESMLNRFVSVSQGALYLKDLFDFFEIQPRIHSPANITSFSASYQTWVCV
jgi:ATP-binding cassette subfamily B protein